MELVLRPLEGETKEFFDNLCNQNSLTPLLLKRILYFKIRGFNNADISKELGIHRVTVQRYVEVMRKLTQGEMLKIIEGIYQSTRD